jgi:hypothetical protein
MFVWTEGIVAAPETTDKCWRLPSGKLRSKGKNAGVSFSTACMVLCHFPRLQIGVMQSLKSGGQSTGPY